MMKFRQRSRAGRGFWQWASSQLAALLACAFAAALSLPTPAQAVENLRIVGGLGQVSQFTRHERPFWETTLPQLTQGRVQAVIVPFDEAGLRGSELLRLMQVGAVPFATALLPLVSTQDAALGAPDLAGLNPDMGSLRAHLAAFRPYLEKRLRDRWGIELLAVYVYPAQVAFCTKPFESLAGLAGRRIRSSSTTQSDLVEALGAIPVQTGFSDIVPKLRNGDIECAMTGTMSGNTIGLHEVTSHVHTMATNWGLAIVGANQGAWNALSPALRDLLRRELPRLERAIWDDADRETSMGLACNSGAATCAGGRAGRMVVVETKPADKQRMREIFVSTVLPRWVQRCGAVCATVWNETLGPVTGVQAASPP